MVNIYILSYNINYMQSIVIIMNIKTAVFYVLFKWSFKYRNFQAHEWPRKKHI